MERERLLARWWWALLLAGSCWLLLAPSSHAQSAAPTTVMAKWQVEPAVAAPGDALIFSLLLQNPTDAEQLVSVTATLPAGFELSLADLPVGAAYSLRAGVLTWSGVLPPGGSRRLALPGRAPSELLADGRLPAMVAIRSGEEEIHLAATGWVGAEPRAAFEVAPAEGLTVRFMQQSDGVGPLSYWWDFGDGTSSTEAAPSHSYPAGGEYTVRLTSANPMGASTASATLQVTAPALPAETPPAAQGELELSDDTPAVGQPVDYGAAGAGAVTVRWNLGDGTTSDLWNLTHVYQQPGVYTVTRVLGEGEMAMQSSRVIRVDVAPEASIQVRRTLVGVGELITLTAVTSAGDVSEYYWNLGDGQTASHQTVAHSYSVPGVYPITLTVGNDFGVALDTLTLQVAPYTLYMPLVVGGGPAGEMIEAETPAVEAPATEAPAPAPAEAVDPTLPADPLARAMLQAINAERAAYGMTPLSWSSELSRSAQHHSEDMAAYGFTGHYGSDGSRPIDRMRQASYSGDYAGECTAWGFDDLESAVAWWMTSPPHRVIILSTVATEIGGGYGYNPGAPSVHYWTIDFGAR